MKPLQINKFRLVFHPLFWMAIAVALLVTSCASADPNAPFTTSSGQPVKGATLLMRH